MRDQVPENATVLFTDLDVVPLGRYSTLLELLTQDHEVLWMRNPGFHPVNCGFFLMRNNPNVRAFLARWRERLLPGGGNQALCNQLLLGEFGSSKSKTRRRSRRTLRWSLFPETLVRSGLSTQHVNGSTVAFHAIGAGDHSSKMRLVGDAFQALSNATGRTRHPWQVGCSVSDRTSGCDTASFIT